MKRRFLWAAVAAVGVFLSVAVLFAAELGKHRLESHLSEFFRAPVRIQRLTFSPKRLTLHGVQIEPAKQSFLVVDQLQIEGSFLSAFGRRSVFSWWREGRLDSVQVTRLSLLMGGFPLEAQGRLFLTKVPHSAVRCDGWLQFDHPLLEGRMELSGTVLEPVILGWLQREKGLRKHFVSKWSLSGDQIRCIQMDVQDGWFFNGFLERETTAGGDDSPVFSGSFDLAGQDVHYALKVDALSSAGGKALLEMERETQAPRELSAEWTVRRGSVDFGAVLFGGQARLTGQIELTSPYPVDMKLSLNGVVISEAANWVLPPHRVPELSGRLHGTVALRGPLSRVVSEGELSAKSFSMGQEDFDSGVIRFHGEGPMLQIQNSQLMRSTGVVLVDGRLDFRRLGRPDFFSAVRLSSLERSISWDGWAMSRDPRYSGLQMKRPGADGKVSVGFNYQMDTDVQPQPVQRQGVEIGVPLTEQQKVSIRLNEGEEFLGVEHRKKF